VLLEVFLLLICVAGSGFASGSETALVSASRIRLQHLAAQGLAGADHALGLVNQKERSLVVTLIATNVFNIAAGAIATVACFRWVGSLAPIVATALMTSVLLIFGEICPKAYFRHHAESTLVRAAVIWRFLSWIMAPITLPIGLVTNLLFRIFGKKPKTLYASREDIKLVLAESVESGGLRQHQQEMLESALNYATTIVREVMVPISEVALLPETGRTEELLAMVRDQGHTRIPVYRDRVDQIEGFVNVFDIFFDKNPKTFIRSYVRQARLVPDTKRIDQLFVEMQRERESIAIVVNEFGTCFGIVTLEDIIEEIFGELADEHEDYTPQIEEKAPGHFRVSGGTDIDDLKEETGISLVKAGFETVAGYVLHRLGRIPRKGEAFTDGDLSVRILEADRYSVKTVELKKMDKEHLAEEV
jgi:CBS domain containing-hemolysin-like protein